MHQDAYINHIIINLIKYFHFHALNGTIQNILKTHINRYINDPQAKKYNSFKSGRPLLDDENAYCLYSAFYNDLKK